MKFVSLIVVINIFLTHSKAYKDKLYNLVTIQVQTDPYTCKTLPRASLTTEYPPMSRSTLRYTVDKHKGHGHDTTKTVTTVTASPKYEQDPVKYFELLLNHALYGEDESKKMQSPPRIPLVGSDIDLYAHAPSGNVMRGELFLNKSGVHLTSPELMHRGHCFLRLTYDYMQTAVNAFAIMLHGNIDDVLRLPPEYVLKSARTISMMKIAREKLVATWTVIKGDDDPIDITYETLEMYRPLFQYISGREMAKLNLLDPKILSYIGTHAALNRHQMGVVASKYIQVNPNWKEPKYLNLMNNLLCGVPMTFMRRVPENIYLQLSNQLFFHIRACDPLQRRFYLAMMSRTQVLGKSNSWRARDVARLGLLLTEVDGPELSAINPEAFVGFSAQVMSEMSATNLVYITDKQLEYLGPRVRNILANKIKFHFEEMEILNGGQIMFKYNLGLLMLFIILILNHLM